MNFFFYVPGLVLWLVGLWAIDGSTRFGQSSGPLIVMGVGSGLMLAGCW